LDSLVQYLSSEPEKNIQAIVRLAAETLKATCAVYNKVDGKTGMLVTCAEYGLPPDYNTKTPPEGRLCYETVINGNKKAVVIEDLQSTPFVNTDPNIKKYGYRSYLATPVKLEGIICGALCLKHTEKGVFSQKDIPMVMTLAKMLSLEEERNQYRNAVRQRLAWEKMLVDISTIAISIEDVRTFIDKCIDRMRQTIEVEGIFMWKYDQAADTVSILSEWIIEGHISQKDKLQNIPASMFPWGMGLMRQNQTMEFEDIEEVPEGNEKEIMRAMGVKSILMIPLFVDNEFYGTFGFEVYSHYRKWLDEDINILRTVSQIITRAIEQYRAEKSLEEANRDLEEKVRKRTSELSKTLKKLQDKQKQLINYKSRLEEMNKTLMETNNALRVLAKNIEKTKEQEERKVAKLITTQIMPVLNRLRKKKMPQAQKREIELLFGHMSQLAKALEKGKGIPALLSASEMRVAALIKNGLNTRQVAQQLNISEETVKTHRRNIRKKLNIQNKNISLAAYLRSKWEVEE